MKRAHGFTLAEVLITITVIGIIAAVTIPTILNTFHERSASYRQANIVYKVTQAVNTMKANGELIRFNSTDEFVDVLQKYLKIAKRCDSEHIAECWPTEKVTSSDNKVIYIKHVKTRRFLGFKNNGDVKNVGLILNDGASLIMTYNPDNSGLLVGDKLIATTKSLPVGGGKEENLNYTTNATSGLAFVMDINGKKGPNSETIGAKWNDIRNLNGATFGGCAGIKINEKCFTPIDSYEALDCSKKNVQWNSNINGWDYSTGTHNHPENIEYCGNDSAYNNDYWAGANKICKEIGAELPSSDTIRSACRSQYYSALGMNGHNSYWTADVDSYASSRYLNTDNSVYNCAVWRHYGRNRDLYKYNVLCVN